ncbi:uncharacterized protein PAE49_022287 [Odontesthes bonariensis]|uniref:uncharacterized protein LOC142370141 n=1 Tax=Odontesthes bonariensis TaxID=219752 RepID=UPI003F580BD7
METKYPTLRRPKRKLCYITDKESPSKQWGGALTLQDVDKMFDDIDSCTPLHPPSPLLQSSDTETNPSETQISLSPQEKCATEKPSGHQMGPKGDVPHPAAGSPSPKLDIDLEVPFKAHGPVKTSSPIEQKLGVEEQDNEKDQVVSPILFNCVDEAAEEPNMEPNIDPPPPTQKPHCNGLSTEESADADLESPPSRVTLTKRSCHKMQANASCGRENTQTPVSAVRQESELAAPGKNSESVDTQPPAEMSLRVGKDMNAFLEKLKLVGKSRPTCYKKSPIKAPPPPTLPEPEDDFLILEDDAPLWFSIPSKSATSKRPGLSKTSSTDKESSADKGTDNSPLESQQERQELEKANSKEERQTIKRNIKKKEKNPEVTGAENDKNDLPTSQDLPATDLTEQEKPKKKKRQLKKFSSKERDNKEDQPKDLQKEKTSLATKRKANKSSERKNSKDCKENTNASRANTLKDARKRRQGSDDLKEMEHVDVGVVEKQSQEQSSKEPTDAEFLGSFSDRETQNSNANERTKGSKQPAVRVGSSSEDAEVHGKRRRKQTGHWWLSSPQGTEESGSQQATLKRSKQKSVEPNTAVLSPVKAKNERVNRKINQKHPAQLSSEQTKKSKERTTKQTKKRKAKGDVPDKIKAADEIFSPDVAEQEQQEICDQDLDQQESSPLVFSHRDHGVSSGGHIFQRVYHHGSSDKIAAPVSHRQHKEELREEEPAKRRRKPPGNWWTIDSVGDYWQSSSTQPQQPHPKEPKPRQERRKQSKQRKSNGLDVSRKAIVLFPSKPPGGAPMPPLKPLSAPKTVKRSLATFKDIFTSVTETPIVVDNRDAHQSNGCNVISHPAEEVSAIDFPTCSRTDKDVLGGDVGGCRGTQPNHSTPQDRGCQSDNTLKVLRSGPSSMIELEQYEENDDMILPSSRVQAVLSVSDLCAPPLKPLTLHPKDKANLTEWFQSLWSTSADDGAAVTPDQFDWYSYQDRALGFQVDLNSGSICSGKILLGSHMKKPLWVDHSATTVFNLLTSLVSVTIDGGVSRYRPGQAFMVECGKAYSIQNNNAQPAVLYFTRILAESPD